jgi:hypothetical protein
MAAANAQAVPPITGPVEYQTSQAESAALRGESLTSEKIEVTCEAARVKAIGEIAGPQTGTQTITFEYCKEPAKAKTCQSEGAPGGTIVTKALATDIGYIKAPDEVGMDLKPAEGEVLYEFTCASEIVGRVKGSVIGRLLSYNTESLKRGLNEMTTDWSLEVHEKEEGQEITSLEGGSSDTITFELSTHGSTGPFLSEMKPRQVLGYFNENLDAVIETKKRHYELADPIEIRTGASAPEWGRCRVQKKPRGRYSNASCTTLATKKHKGHWEWHPVPS